jgi:hypothetical protein
MKKYVPKNLFFLLCLFAATDYFAQTDSTGFKFSGFQADIGTGLYTTPTTLDQQKFQSFIPADALLYADLTGYRAENYYTTGGRFDGMIGGKAFFRLKKSKRNYELFAGLRYSEAQVAYSTYVKTTYDTLYTYADPQGQTNYLVNKQTDEFGFSIWGRRLFVPLGVNVSTNPDNFFWFTAGIEIAPFIAFDHRFVSSRAFTYYDMIVEAGTDPDQMLAGSSSSATRWQEQQKVKGLGGGAYVGIPLAIYFHPFRKETSFLRTLNFFGTLMPLFTASSTKFSEPAYGVLFQANAGVRVNFSK